MAIDAGRGRLDGGSGGGSECAEYAVVLDSTIDNVFHCFSDHEALACCEPDGGVWVLLDGMDEIGVEHEGFAVES